MDNASYIFLPSHRYHIKGHMYILNCELSHKCFCNNNSIPHFFLWWKFKRCGSKSAHFPQQ